MRCNGYRYVLAGIVANNRADVSHLSERGPQKRLDIFLQGSRRFRVHGWLPAAGQPRRHVPTAWLFVSLP